jgi:hypothetical protein
VKRRQSQWDYVCDAFEGLLLSLNALIAVLQAEASGAMAEKQSARSVQLLDYMADLEKFQKKAEALDDEWELEFGVLEEGMGQARCGSPYRGLAWRDNGYR